MMEIDQAIYDAVDADAIRGQLDRGPLTLLTSRVCYAGFEQLLVAGFLFAFTVYGILTPLVVYLLGVGYRPAIAAIVLSFTLDLNAVGKVLFGVVADRIGAKLSLALSFAIIASGIILLFGSHETVGLAIFLLIYGPRGGLR
jgi:MFS family permease